MKNWKCFPERECCWLSTTCKERNWEICKTIEEKWEKHNMFTAEAVQKLNDMPIKEKKKYIKTIAKNFKNTEIKKQFKEFYLK